VVRDALTSPASIRTLVNDADRAGITDLLVQVRGRGDAYYESNLVPTAAPMETAFHRNGPYDPLDLVLELAHAKGIRVHAWLNVYLVTSASKIPRGHVAFEHPEWMATDPSGKPMMLLSAKVLKDAWTEGAYLDPGLPEVIDHFTAVVHELVANYPLDGVHLDYVRYPHLDVGYNQVMRDAFRRQVGVDPLELVHNREGLMQERGEAGVKKLRRQWQGFKASRITTLVEHVRTELRLTRPGMMLSAAVKPNADEARTHYGQDWVAWVNGGLVDFVAPMMYSTSEAVMRKQAAAAALAVPPAKVWAGIAVYNQSLSSAAAKIQVAEQAGLGGVSIFSYNSVPGGGPGLVRLNRR
jgi:uncharacterized lipoprotein YddW (UPF0748 family)